MRNAFELIHDHLNKLRVPLKEIKRIKDQFDYFGFKDDVHVFSQVYAFKLHCISP